MLQVACRLVGPRAVSIIGPSQVLLQSGLPCIAEPSPLAVSTVGICRYTACTPALLARSLPLQNYCVQPELQQGIIRSHFHNSIVKACAEQACPHNLQRPSCLTVFVAAWAASYSPTVAFAGLCVPVPSSFSSCQSRMLHGSSLRCGETELQRPARSSSLL